MDPEIIFYSSKNEYNPGFQETPPNILPHLIHSSKIPETWSQNSNDDFILVGEFSEIEGPRPLFTIPKNINTSLDKNEFIVRLMSVDCHGTVKTRIPHSDSHIFLTESNGIYAYIHHFTLTDIQARAFVRPFCLSYISTDKRKLMTYFNELMKEFSEVSQIFLYGNRMLFLRNIEHRIKDLEYTREKLLFWLEEKNDAEINDQKPENIFKNITVEAIDLKIKDLKLCQESIKKYMNNSKVEQILHQLEERTKLKIKLQDEKSSTNFLFKNSHYSLNSEDKDYKRRKSLNDINEECMSLPPYLSDTPYQPKLLVELQNQCEISLKSLYELCHWGAKAGINKLWKIYKYFNQRFEVFHVKKMDKEAEGNGMKNSYIFLGPYVGGSVTNANLTAESQVPQHYSSLYLTDNGSLPSNLEMSTSGSYNLDDFATPDSSLPDRESYCSCDNGNSKVVNKDDVKEIFDSTFNVNVPDYFTYEDIHLQDISDIPDSCVTNLISLNSESWGYGIKVFLQDYYWAKHIIYSLMIGRPVVVLGSSQLKQQIIAMVTTLAVFVPSKAKAPAVILWQNQPLKLVNLAYVRLIGLFPSEKKTMYSLIPNSVQRYISLINLDNKVVTCPKYQGKFFEQLCSKSEQSQNDSVLLNYLMCCYLDILKKTFLYYQFKRNLTKQEESNNSNNFFKTLDISDGDLLIIKYLYELVKDKQIHSIPNQGFCAPVFHGQLQMLETFVWK